MMKHINQPEVSSSHPKARPTGENFRLQAARRFHSQARNLLRL
jgi:hypothetical protein